MEKPTFKQLLDWLEGRLDAGEARILESRLRSADAEMKAELEWLRAFLGTAEAARRTALPPGVRADLVRDFEVFARTRRAPRLLQRLIATLASDTAGPFALEGARSVQAEGKQRQLIYESDPAEIALNIFPNSQDENLTLSGQIYSKTDLSPAGLTVQIIALEGTVKNDLTTSDDLGEFALVDIPQGRYNIFISAEGIEIVIPEILLLR